MPAVKLPNGTRLNFPDGMSQADMADAIDSNFPEYRSKPSQDPMDADSARFAKAADLKAKAQSTERTWSEAAGDTVRSAAQGLIDVGGVLPGVAYGAATGDYNNPWLKTASGMNDIIGENMSAKSKAEQAAVQAAMDSADGFVERATVGGVETFRNPAALLNTAVRSLPGMMAGGVAGRVAGAGAEALGTAAVRGASSMASPLASAGLKVAGAASKVGASSAVGTAAVSQGASVASDTYAEAMKAPIEAFRAQDGFAELAAQHGEDKAKSMLASSAANRAGLAATAVSLLAMRYTPGGATIEKAFLPKAMREAEGVAAQAGTGFFTKPLTKGMSGGVGAKAAEMLVKGTTTGFQEGISEGIEEGGGAVAKALETSRITGETPNLAELAGDAFGQAFPVGAVMGKAAGVRDAYAAPKVEDQPVTPQAPPTTPQPSPQGGTNTAEEILRREALLDGEPVTPPAQPVATGEGAGGSQPTQVAATPEVAAYEVAPVVKPSGDGSVIPTVADPQANLRAEMEAIKQRAALPDETAVAGTEQDLQPGETRQNVPATIPQPGEAQRLVDEAKAKAAKHSDLADQQQYSDASLQRIAEHPDTQKHPDLLDAARGEIARRAQVAERRQQQFDAARSGDSVDFPELPGPRPLSVDRGVQILQSSMTRALIPQEKGYLDALKSEMGERDFGLMQRNTVRPYSVRADERKFEIPRVVQRNQEAIAQWDAANQPRAQAQEGVSSIDTLAQPPAQSPKEGISNPTLAQPKGLATEMAQIKGAKVNAAPVKQPAPKTVAQPAPKGVQNVDTLAAGGTRNGFASDVTEAIDKKDGKSLIPSTIFGKLSKIALGMPTFKGNKRTMLAMAVSAIKAKLNADKITQVDDWFAGGGMWSTSLANATLPNVKKIRIAELNPLRIKRIQWMHERGDKLIEDMHRTGALRVYLSLIGDLKKDGVVSPSPFEKVGLVAAGFEGEGSVGWDRAKKAGVFELSDEGKMLLSALGDLAFNNRGVKVHQHNTKITLPNGNFADKFLAKAANEMAAAKAESDVYKGRGGAYEYFPAGSSFDLAPKHMAKGEHVLSLADPPYYNTSGYKGAGDFSTGDKWNAKGYAATRDLLKTLVDGKNQILYTDEAWWRRGDQMADKDQAGTILRSINQSLSDLHVAPEKVGGRYEQLGLHNPNARGGSDSGSPGGEVRQEPVGQGDGRGVLRAEGGLAPGAGGQGGRAAGATQGGLKFSKAAASPLKSALGYFDNYPVGYPIGYAKSDPVERSVPVADIVPTQDSVHSTYTDEYAKDAPESLTPSMSGVNTLPEVVLDKKSGKYILLDGHHRVVGKIQRGDTSVRVNVVGDVEKAQVFSGIREDMQADWRASHPEQSKRTVTDVVTGEKVGQSGTVAGDSKPAFSKKPQNLDQDVVLEFPTEDGKTAKLTVNAQRYIDTLNAREDALKMVKECMA